MGGWQKINSLSPDSYPIDARAYVKRGVSTRHFYSHADLHTAADLSRVSSSLSSSDFVGVSSVFVCSIIHINHQPSHRFYPIFSTFFHMYI